MTSRSRRVVAAAAVMAVVLSGCEASGAVGPGGGRAVTVAGLVTAGPTCPVERPGQSCPARPVRGTLHAIGTSGRSSATAQITAGGRYSLRLRPGRYRLEVHTGATFPQCPVTRVTVAAGRPRHLDISCDTGIR